MNAFLLVFKWMNRFAHHTTVGCSNSSSRDRIRAFVSLCVFALAALGNGSTLAADAIALGYEPKYRDFTHYDYADPRASKGGEVILSGIGSFDTLNPFVLKGIAAGGLTELVFESLMDQSWDEPFSLYAHLADDIALAPDKLSVTFRIDARARFSDGGAVTPEDVKFSFDTLKGKLAHPRFRFMWADIAAAEVVDARRVRFRFAKVNPELHLIVAQMPIFSRRWVGDTAFNKVALQKPIGSGPYTVQSYALGKRIVYARNPRYWARDLNTRRGMFNFDRVAIKYYQDESIRLEGFKAGEFEFNLENHSKQWARDYTGPQFADGRIRKVELKHSNNAGMQGFVFNTRRPLFQDKRVRRAISAALDFEWSNRNLFYNQYTRCDSYFSNSELAARGLPVGPELALLKPLRDRLDPAVFTEVWRPYSTASPNSLRNNLREAKALLAEAGWQYRDGALRTARGEPFVFEFLIVQKGFERIVAPFARNLALLGVEMRSRKVDAALYQRRVETFDYDMVVDSFGQSMSPGNEQINYWHSSTANQEGSANSIGVRDPAIDALVEKVVYAPNRASLVTATRALDRVLLHQYFIVPNWYIATHRVAYWDRFAFPARLPLYYNAETWFLRTAWRR